MEQPAILVPPNIIKRFTMNADDFPLDQLYRDYLKVTGKNQQAAATMVLANVVLCLWDELHQQHLDDLAEVDKIKSVVITPDIKVNVNDLRSKISQARGEVLHGVVSVTD